MLPLSPRLPLMSPLSRFNYSLPTTPTYQPSPGLPLGGYSPFSPHNPMTAPGLMGQKNAGGGLPQFSFDPEHIRAYQSHTSSYGRGRGLAGTAPLSAHPNLGGLGGKVGESEEDEDGDITPGGPGTGAAACDDESTPKAAEPPQRPDSKSSGSHDSNKHTPTPTSVAHAHVTSNAVFGSSGGIQLQPPPIRLLPVPNRKRSK